MTERSRFWDGTTIGDAAVAPYDASTEFALVLMALTGAVDLTDKGGVFGVSGGLAATSPGANTVRIAAGEAQVYGTWYQNDANADTTIPTPSASTRIDRIVLRKSWSAQTVRITRIAGVEGGGAPALVQDAGTSWDVPLCQVSITTGGVMTITDQRALITPVFINQPQTIYGIKTFRGIGAVGTTHRPVAFGAGPVGGTYTGDTYVSERISTVVQDGGVTAIYTGQDFFGYVIVTGIQQGGAISWSEMLSVDYIGSEGVKVINVGGLNGSIGTRAYTVNTTSKVLSLALSGGTAGTYNIHVHETSVYPYRAS